MQAQTDGARMKWLMWALLAVAIAIGLALLVSRATSAAISACAACDG
jgi:hypothetical protein